MIFCYHCMTQIREEKLHICPNCGKSLTADPVSDRYLKPGTVLQNKFIIGYPIGSGGFGNTYIGWNRLLLRKVAVKEFFPEQYIRRTGDNMTVSLMAENLKPRFERGLQQFLEEARNVAALQDIKGVVEISNFFEENGTGYIVMEYLEGMDVKTILQKSGGRKEYEWCRRIILTLLHTLREIHKRGVLHRDIAPDNLFVTDEGVIKLIDFGAARHSDVLADMRAEVVLKEGYAPIEQYSRGAPQGPYTDIYAVAALFYRMLTGQKPIPAKERLGHDTLITPSEMGVTLPEQAEMAIMVCLNIQPQYRLQSADEFMEALEGKNFVPVYESEWILPRVKEKKSFSDIPVWGRAGIIFAAICLLVGIGLGGTAFIRRSGERQDFLSGSSQILADFSGQTLDDAVDELDRMGVENCSVVYELDSQPEGTVLRQQPEAGAVSDDNDIEVTLYVSGGDHQYTMEDFLGKSIEEIRSYFSWYRFDIEENAYPGAEMVPVEAEAGGEFAVKTGKVNLVKEYSENYAAGVCFAQSLTPGQLCDGSENLTFTVSCGKVSDYEIPIPDFSGVGKKKAKKVLEEAGLSSYLKLQFEEDSYDGAVKAGVVTDQSLLPGYIYNTLEKTLYQYENGSRVEQQDASALVLWVNGEPVQNAGSRTNTTQESKGQGRKKQESTVEDIEMFDIDFE